MSLRVITMPSPFCTLHAQQDVELEWIPETNHVAGTEIELRADRWRAWYFWKVIDSEMEGADIVWRWRAYPQLSQHHENPDRRWFTARLPRGARQGEPRRLRLIVIPSYIASIPLDLSIWVKPVRGRTEDPPPAAPESGSRTVIPIHGGPAERLAVWSRPAPLAGGRVPTLVAPHDRCGNPTVFSRPVACELTWQGRTWIEPIQEPRVLALEAPTGIARLHVRVPMDQLGRDENILNAARDGEYLAVDGNPVCPSGNGLRPAFGEMHWHTDFSGDGQGSIELALTNAREVMQLDFAAPGDHSPDPEKWQGTVAAVEAFNQPGNFATFFGWERSTKNGHENFYFTNPEHPLRCHGKYAAAMAARHSVQDEARGDYRAEPDCLCIPHHTNAVCEQWTAENVPVWHPYPWTGPEPALRLVEIMQVRGNQERNRYTDAWMGWHQSHGSSVQDALARGHKLGFTGGTDNHTAWPGRAWEPAEANLLGANNPMHSVILTGVWTEAIERRAVFAALHNRHTWAVWNTRAIVRWEINGVLMGGELSVPSGTQLRGRLRLAAEDSLQTVEIVSVGAVVWQRSFADRDVDVEIPLGVAAPGTHFYVRALQRNGGLIYASPVFVEVSP